MANFDPEAQVVRVFKEKCRLAGGAKAGFNLRRESILYGTSDEQRLACDEAIGTMVESGLLVGNEPGDRFILTEDGVAALAD